MRNLLYIILISIILPFLPSCAGREGRLGMDSAEELLNTDPDSALRILSAIPKRGRSRGANQARYNMLLTEARYKADSLPLDDSIIRISVDYYEIHEDGHNAARARYLAGITDYTNDLYSPALVNFLRAEKFAEQSTDTILCGLIYRSIGDCYNKFYEVNTALEYYIKANSFFRKANAERYEKWGYIDIANQYFNIKNYPKAKEYAQKAKKYSVTSGDITLRNVANNLIAMIHVEKSEVDSALIYYKQISTFDPDINIDFNEKNWMYMGLAYLLKGDLSNAYQCNRHNQSIEPGVNAITLNKLLLEKKYKEGFELMLSTLDILDSVRNTVWTRNDLSVVNEYRRIEDAKADSELKHEKYKNVLLIIIALSVIGIGILLYLLKTNTLKKNLFKALLEAENLKKEINEKETSIKKYNDKLNNQNDVIVSLKNNITNLKKSSDYNTSQYTDTDSNKLELAESRQQARDILSSRFKIINDLLEEYYTYKDTSKEKEKLYAKVKQSLDSFIANKNMVNELEAIVDKNMNGLISDLRKDFPKFNDNYINLFIFIVLNFKSQTISLLQKSSSATIYSRKSKLKKAIIDSSVIRKEEYLDLINK